VASRTVRWLACGAALVFAVTSAVAAPTWIPMDNVDAWHAKMFCGSPAVKWFVQGPKFEGGVAGIIRFDSRGTAYVPAGTFIQEIRGDTVRVLTGAPDITGNTDGPPGAATFGNAIDLALVNDDLMYVVDAANFTLRRLERTDGVWVTTTVAGVPRVKGHRDGPGKQALFTNPFESIAVDEKGVVYVCDGDWLRRFEKGTVTTLNAGNGYVNGPLAKARFSRSQGRRGGMCYDGKGHLYIADKLNMAIRKVDLKKGEVTTIAGVLPGVKKTRPRDGKALDARFHPGGGPNMAFWNPVEQFLIVRSDDERGIRVIKDGWVKTFGGVPGRRRQRVGPWREVSGGVPYGADRWGNVYVSGGGIRIVSKKGVKTPPFEVAPRDVLAGGFTPPRFARPDKTGRGTPDLAEIAPRLSMSDAVPLPRTTVLHQRHPAVAFGKGVYLIVWQEGFSGLGSDSNIVGLRLKADGTPMGDPFFVCKAPGPQEAPAVAYCAGGFLVAWSDFRTGPNADVYARLLPLDPAAKGKQREMLIARGPNGQAHPAVGSNGADQFLLVWQDFRSGGFSLRATRLSPANGGTVLDKDGFEVAGRGERPQVAFNGTNYLVLQKWYGAVVSTDGTVVSPSTALWRSKTVYRSAVTSAWGKGVAVFNTEPFQDPWGWGGNGAIVGATVAPDGASPEKAWEHISKLSNREADGKVKNCLDAARWRMHAGWPMGMPGALKNTDEGTWPSGVPAVAFNGRSVIAVWPRAQVMDRRRLANRDLYLRRVYEGWAFADEYKVKIVAGPTEEANPVLCAGPTGDVLLAYEKVEPAGVGIAYRLLREADDKQAPRVVWTAPISDTKMIVAFDEPVDPAGAAEAGNYRIKGVAVKSAEVVADNRAQQREVILETDAQTRGKTYALTVRGVKDRSLNANPADGAPFSYVCKPGAFERSPFVARWAVKGPFERDWTKTPVDPKAVHPSPGADGWKEATCGGGVLDLGRAVGKLNNKAACANTYVYSDRPRKVIVRIDSNDDNRTWLNGEVINADLLKPGDGRGLHNYVNEVPATLRKGWNQLTVQVGNFIGYWQLAVQITDTDKHPVPDLTWQVENPFK